MNKPQKKIRIIGQPHAELNIERFAEAIIAFALHRARGEGEPAHQVGASKQEGDEESSP
ncbi:MAG: hypothetical protein ACRDYA_13460 [Egibacteraceae bacterium]